MRYLSIIALLAASLGYVGVGEAFAMGGMGDPSTNQRENNARCDAQKRGEYPRDHNACLPDDPPLSYYAPK